MDKDFKQMKAARILYFLSLVAFVSCNVSNTMYINDPKAIGEDEVDGVIGIGTGMQPDIDSVSKEGDIFFSSRYRYAPIVFGAAQIGLTEKLDLRVAAHFPYAAGGFGGRIGCQFAMMPENSKLQMAIGSDFGFVFARDTLRLFGTANAMEVESTGGLNFDFFLPVGFCPSDNFELIITPRYSFNGVFIRKNKHESGTRFYTPMLFGISAGVKVKRFYAEFSNLYFENTVIPSFGVAYTFSSKRQSSEPVYYYD